MQALSSWPPPYTLRKTKRAKYLRLKVSHQGLELVLPYRCSQQEALNFLNSKRDWVEAQLKQLPVRKIPEPPQQLHLLAINSEWRVFYHADSGPARLRENKLEKTLTLSGNYQNQNHWQTLLILWVKKQAKAILPPWLKHLSELKLLPYTSVSIRSQKTRWGSCSANKKINLNYKLLFLNKEMVEHILLHELCHTVHLNHSKNFWALLTKLDPNTSLLEPKSKHTLEFIPEWLGAEETST